MSTFPEELTVSDLFDSDPYPGKPKILFIGHGSSSHAHSWINLLTEDFTSAYSPSREPLPQTTGA